MEDRQDQKAKGASNPSDSIARTLKVLIALALAIAALIVGLYFFQFRGTLSVHTDRWGAFGDYLGGVLNPVFGFFTLIALLFTIILQSRELRMSTIELGNSAQALRDSRDIAAEQAAHFEMQARKEDVYRMIKDVYNELETFYKRSRHIELQTWGNLDKNASQPVTGHFHEFFGKDKIPRNYENLVEAGSEFAKDSCQLIRPLTQLLTELRTYLEQFEGIAGDTIVTGYYKRRYRQVCTDLAEKGYLDAQTSDFYKLDEPVSARIDPGNTLGSVAAD